jgi:hypothetical protein
MVSHWHRLGFSEWSGLGSTICVCIKSFMIVDLFRDIFIQRTLKRLVGSGANQWDLMIVLKITKLWGFRESRSLVV